MTLLEAIEQRHSVRSYLDKEVDGELRERLQSIVDACNNESGLNIQLVWDEPRAFDSFMARYGKFSGVKNYVALVGKKGSDESVGYYGEKIALSAQSLGLNTCWVALTYKKIKNAFSLAKGEKLFCVLCLGYGATVGAPHGTKSVSEVSSVVDGAPAPEWFVDGVKAALLAPTAMNQQKFTFIYDNGAVRTKAGVGFYSKIDLGIAKLHFGIGSAKDKLFGEL